MASPSHHRHVPISKTNVL